MSTSPSRFTFNRGLALAILFFIEEAERTGDWQPVRDRLTPEQVTLAEQVGLAAFDPDQDYEHTGTVAQLIDLAESAGWLTGPSTPLYEVTEDDGMCVINWEVRDGGTRVPLTLGWQDVSDLIDFDDDQDDEDGARFGYVRNTGATAATDMLGHMADQMNDRMAQLDAYVAAQIDRHLSELLNAADDDEDAMIQEVRVRAGHLWSCTAPMAERPEWNCAWRNRADESECGECGAPRPSDDETKAA